MAQQSKDPYERMARKLWIADGRPSRKKQLAKIERLFNEVRAAQKKPGYLKKVIAKMEENAAHIRQHAKVNMDRLNMRFTR